MTALRPQLVVVTDAERVGPAALPARLEPWLARAEPGSVLVQLRDPSLGVRQRLELGRALRVQTRRHGQLLAVNDRLDLARLLAADAVHLGEGSVDPADARAFCSPGCFVTAAWHPPSAPRLGADAFVVSPVQAARKGRPALGAAGLADAVRRAAELTPGALVYALGGVTPAGVPACLAAGAWGVAAISAVLDEPDPEPLLRALQIVR